MSDDLKIKNAINKFFESAKELKNLGVIDSDRYLGDIGEYIFTKTTLGAALEANKRTKGHDSTFDGKKYQVKLNNSPTKTNINIGNTNEYDILILIIGPDSCLTQPHGNNFLVYEFNATDLANRKYIAKTELNSKKNFKVYSLE